MVYVFPGEGRTGDTLIAFCEQARERLDQATQSNETQRGAIAARIQGASLYTSNASLEVTVYAVDTGYFDLYHETLLCGRLVTEYDVNQANRAIVLDEGAALSLFSESEPLGRSLTLNDAEYEVTGVIRGGRRIGEADAYVAYIPLTAASSQGMQPTSIECSAPARENIGQSILFRDMFESWRPDGSFYDLAREKMGAAMPLRLAAALFAIAFLLMLVNRWNLRAWKRICHYRAELRTKYVRQLLIRIVGDVLLLMAGYGACIGAGFLLMQFLAQPLTIFPEWVPEVIVEISSLKTRFWSLAWEGASAVRCLCRDAFRIQLGGTLILWGVLTAALGFLLRMIPLLAVRKKAEPWREPTQTMNDRNLPLHPDDERREMAV